MTCKKNYSILFPATGWQYRNNQKHTIHGNKEQSNFRCCSRI